MADFGEDLLDVAKEEKYTDGQANFTLSGSHVRNTRQATWNAELRFLGHTVASDQWRSFLSKAKQVRTRYHHELAAHMLDKKQLAALEQEVKGLGYEAYLLRNVYNPKLAVIFANGMLGSGRISTSMRGKILTTRALGLLSLGFYDAAAVDINAAFDLDNPDDPNLLASAGVIAFAKEQKNQALEFINQAYELAPHELWIHHAKQHIGYVLGESQVAQSEEDNQEPDDKEQKSLQTALFKSLVAKRNGADGKASLIEWQAQQKDKQTPLYAFAQYFLGEIDLKAITERTMQKGGRHQLHVEILSMFHFFTAEKFLLEGNMAAATEYWQKALDTKVFDNFSHIAAKYRLANKAAQ